MQKMSSKKRPFTSIGEVIDQVLCDYKPQAKSALAGIWEVWPNIVGASVAKISKPAAIKGGVLIVHVSNSNWLHQLRYQERIFISDLNRVLGGDVIASIKFKIGPV
jgi:predicted nucleic acid-binding Zn ribbon protein